MPPVERDVQGVIKEVYDGDYGTVVEGDTTGSGKPPRDFFQPGAKVDFENGTLVVYIEVTFPDAGPGKDPVIRSIRKRP